MPWGKTNFQKAFVFRINSHIFLSVETVLEDHHVARLQQIT